MDGAGNLAAAGKQYSAASWCTGHVLPGICSQLGQHLHHRERSTTELPYWVRLGKLESWLRTDRLLSAVMSRSSIAIFNHKGLFEASVLEFSNQNHFLLLKLENRQPGGSIHLSFLWEGIIMCEAVNVLQLEQEIHKEHWIVATYAEGGWIYDTVLVPWHLSTIFDAAM